jgi:hypothetical protein
MIQEKRVNNIYVPTPIFRGLLLSLMIEGSGFIAVYAMMPGVIIFLMGAQRTKILAAHVWPKR